VTSDPKLMSQFSRFQLVFKALQQLGPSQLGLFMFYQLGLRTGHFQRTLTSALKNLERIEGNAQFKFQPYLTGLPDPNDLLEQIGPEVDKIYKEANEIVNGNVRLFGGQPVPLELTLPEPLEYWTEYERGTNLIQGKDIKYIWEPGRFGWAFKLAMAYHLTNDEQYAETFWLYTEQFLASNPAYMGPHWSSAQEVAIRLVALTFAIQVFVRSQKTTSERLEIITKTIAIHAERIPTTLVYARSQNNNHLITEAMGLYTASAVLPNHPLASKWHNLGWGLIKHAFLTQITIDGTYTQHSTNYHRLMLQAALWAHAVHESSFANETFPPDVRTRLEGATRWLWKLVDPDTGHVPNMGHNDGAYILPLTVCAFHDYRPVLHAAARAFLQVNLIPSGPWDDMATWMCSPNDKPKKNVGLKDWQLTPQRKELNTQAPYCLMNRINDSWATMQVANFYSRPAHADQLHVDLWWHGYNLAQDPGTYLYNSSPPWDNSLTSAFVHNTVVVDGQESMHRAGRFLYLDWAQARVLELHTSPDGTYGSLNAEHDGYRKIGVIHSRKVIFLPNGHWEVHDNLEGPPDNIHAARLHWLLPDCEYEIKDLSQINDLWVNEIRIKTPFGWVGLKIGLISNHEKIGLNHAMSFQLAREGKIIAGSGSVLPITGWTSPTYGEKKPALAWILNISQTLPIKLKSEWILSNES
jgi:hypothetical protein